MDTNHPTLRQIQGMLSGIYGKRNAAMYGSSGLLLRVFEETAAVAEALRKEYHKDLVPVIARFFAWLLGFCTNEHINLDEAVFGKYHGACPYCGRTMHCLCISVETKPKEWRRKKNTTMPKSLPAWQEMFKKIYGRVNTIAGTEKCWLHIHEELGEVSRAYRLKARGNLRDELADVFAWLAAFCNNSRIDIESAVLERYQGRCDVCAKEKCRCPKV
jgi:NTP pyrophosphatase (non-canonical NTP hydrolase)